MISNAYLGLVFSIYEVVPDADWQRCALYFYRSVFSNVPQGKMREVPAVVKAIRAQETRGAVESKSKNVIGKLG